MPQSARDLAVDVLLRMEQDRTFSTAAVDDLLKRNYLGAADASLVTRLIYGTIERRLTLDTLLGEESRRPLKNCHPAVLAVMRVAAYQIIFMDRVPNSAAVNEAVKQVRSRGQAYAAGYVNRVLRALCADGANRLNALPNDMAGISVRYSIPTELLSLWCDAYGSDMAYSLAAASVEEKPAVVRVNTLTTDFSAFTRLLGKSGIGFQTFPDLPGALQIRDPAALYGSCDTRCFYPQDAASQYDCLALGAQEGERVADLCACPGGKTLTLAQYMRNRGEILALDTSREKVEALKERCARMGVCNVKAECRDVTREWDTALLGGFDRVLCDVPCSGFGVIRRRPEIRYKSLSSVASLPELQYAILCRGADLVRQGGVLQYSTCTLNPAENEQVAGRFLREHPDFSPRILPLPRLRAQSRSPLSHTMTLFPPVHGTDGFFIASFVKGDPR